MSNPHSTLDLQTCYQLQNSSVPLITPETALAFGHPFTSETAKLAVAMRKPKAKKPRTTTDNTYPARQLRLTRKRIKVLGIRIDEELAKKDCDGQRVNWLSTALERLSEQERVLANRPLPGSLRPTDTKRSQSKPLPEPSPTPQSVVEPTSITSSTSVTTSDSKPAN